MDGNRAKIQAKSMVRPLYVGIPETAPSSKPSSIRATTTVMSSCFPPLYAMFSSCGTAIPSQEWEFSRHKDITICPEEWVSSTCLGRVKMPTSVAAIANGVLSSFDMLFSNASLSSSRATWPVTALEGSPVPIIRRCPESTICAQWQKESCSVAGMFCF